MNNISAVVFLLLTHIIIQFRGSVSQSLKIKVRTSIMHISSYVLCPTISYVLTYSVTGRHKNTTESVAAIYPEAP